MRCTPSLQSRFCEDALSRIPPRPFFQRRTPVDFQRFFNDFGSFFGLRPSIHYGAEPTTSNHRALVVRQWSGHTSGRNVVIISSSLLCPKNVHGYAMKAIGDSSFSPSPNGASSRGSYFPPSPNSVSFRCCFFGIFCFFVLFFPSFFLGVVNLFFCL